MSGYVRVAMEQRQLPREVIAYATAGGCGIAALAIPVAEITSKEGVDVNASAGGWLGGFLVVGVALLALGGRLIRGSLFAIVGGVLLDLVGVLLVGLVVALATYGNTVIVDMWDSDAGGRHGPGVIVIVAGALCALVGLVLDIGGGRRRVA